MKRLPLSEPTKEVSDFSLTQVPEGTEPPPASFLQICHRDAKARFVLNHGRDWQVVGRTEGEIRRFFPGQKDSLKLAWAGDLPVGDYTTILTVSYGDHKVYTETLPLQIVRAANSAAVP
jgi:hypothetical protein